MNQNYRSQRNQRYSHNEELQAFATLKQAFHYLTQAALAPLLRFYRFLCYTIERPRDGRRIAGSWLFHNVFTFCNLLIVIWCWILFWGEVSVFSNSVEACTWGNWERWPSTASPHHLAFVADPQLVDPHTYPGRPWPLSTLTVKHTDIYLRRSYSRLQRDLRPDTIFFLGDLFDGGREWSTPASQSDETQYHKYGEEYWHREHDRFSNIFLRDWSGGMNYPQIIASLPGNHDLGFGIGIKEPVRARFNAFFGESNRIDIIGNHTFVSLDSVSLSAKDEETTENTSAIWRPSEDFLDTAERSIAAAVDRHLNLTEISKPKKYKHDAVELSDQTYINHQRPAHSSAHMSFPTILLTHVPLYRPHGTPCGPLRERFPPIPPPPGETNPVEPDEDNAISISHGVQYQNVLTRAISLSISERLGNAIEYAFSGDDHDYCELVHKSYPNKGVGIREITVKSISWAMGVRRPGFVMVSMFNPVDGRGSRISWPVEGELDDDKHLDTTGKTLQTHLCLLPDQLSIFIRYAVCFGATVSLLLLRALSVAVLPASFGLKANIMNGTLLPTFTTNGHRRRKSHSVSYGDDDYKQTTYIPLQRRHSSFDDTTRVFLGNSIVSGTSRSSPEESSSAIPSSISLSTRSASAMQSRERSPLPAYGYGMGTPAGHDSTPLVSHATKGEPNDWMTKEDEKYDGGRHGRKKSERGKFSHFFLEFVQSFWQVARVVLVWYLWLQWR